MRNILTTVDAWLSSGKKVALATVTQTWGSAPRPAGAMMAFAESGDMIGSVSGGCIEGAVAQTAAEVLESGVPQYLSFSASYQAAWDVGLACGGEVAVVVQILDEQRYEIEKKALRDDRGYIRAILTQGDDELLGATVLADENGILYTSCTPAMTETLAEKMNKLPFTENSGDFDISLSSGTVGFSFSRERSRPQLICVGGTHVAMFLTQLALPLGYSTIVIDPRGIFATENRFPHVDKLLHVWPQEAFSQIQVTSETAICVLTHDPKIDIPALVCALDTPAFYIGSLGRPTTQKQRYRSLVEKGCALKEIERIYGPIGLDLGGRLPEEIALAIFAEITETRYGRNGASRRMLEFAS
jgi:xanthine dehydrogenase accessory factor